MQWRDEFSRATHFLEQSEKAFFLKQSREYFEAGSLIIKASQL